MSSTVVPPRSQNRMVIHSMMLPETSELINLCSFVELRKSYVTHNISCVGWHSLGSTMTRPSAG